MTKLNQIIAAEGGSKKRQTENITEVYKILQKDDLFAGVIRTYSPVDDEGEDLPEEKKIVQHTVPDSIDEAKAAWVDLFDLTLTKDAANMTASADVVIDGQVIVENVPVTTLLFLEKRLNDVKTLIGKLPTLDPAFVWEPSDAAANLFRTEPSQSARTKKVLEYKTLAPATERHPAQVESYTVDVVAGYWTTQKLSGAIHGRTRAEMADRVDALIKAVRFAREEANVTEVIPRNMGANIMKAIFGED